jgi:hypothetical protein
MSPAKAITTIATADAEPLRPDDEVEAAWEEGLMLLNHRKPDKQVRNYYNKPLSPQRCTTASCA